MTNADSWVGAGERSAVLTTASGFVGVEVLGRGRAAEIVEVKQTDGRHYSQQVDEHARAEPSA